MHLVQGHFSGIASHHLRSSGLIAGDDILHEQDVSPFIQSNAINRLVHHRISRVTQLVQYQLLGSTHGWLVHEWSSSQGYVHAE